MYLPPKPLAWCRRTLDELGFHDDPISGHFITSQRTFEIPGYYKALLREARQLEESQVERGLPLEDRNLALLQHLTQGYLYEPVAAVVRAWEHEDRERFVRMAENYEEDDLNLTWDE